MAGVLGLDVEHAAGDRVELHLVQGAVLDDHDLVADLGLAPHDLALEPGLADGSALHEPGRGDGLAQGDLHPVGHVPRVQLHLGRLLESLSGGDAGEHQREDRTRQGSADPQGASLAHGAEPSGR